AEVGKPEVIGTYVHDQLRQWGQTTFTYQPTGELLTRVVGGVTTAYDYDGRGNLRSVVLPGGTKTYVYDGLGRRTVAAYGGATVRYIYGEAIGPSAAVDAGGNVVTRFVYGSRSNVPDYMERGGKQYRFVLDH